MTGRRADRGRESVYAAEIAAFDGTSHESVVPFDELVTLARHVTTATWWPHGDIDVVPSRADARSSVTHQRGAGAPVVRLAASQTTRATLLHELAHVLAGVGAGHGPLFRRAHLDLVAYALGDGPARWLADAYDSMGLAPGRRSWPEPPVHPGPGRPIAL